MTDYNVFDIREPGCSSWPWRPAHRLHRGGVTPHRYTKDEAAREPAEFADPGSCAEQPHPRVSRAGCQIQPAQQHQPFMRMIDRTYRKLLVHYASGFTRGDHGRAEDLFQEAMMRAWRNAEWLEAN